jgi:hypothetical protein
LPSTAALAGVPEFSTVEADAWWCNARLPPVHAAGAAAAAGREAVTAPAVIMAAASSATRNLRRREGGRKLMAISFDSNVSRQGRGSRERSHGEWPFGLYRVKASSESVPVSVPTTPV